MSEIKKNVLIACVSLGISLLINVYFSFDQKWINVFNNTAISFLSVTVLQLLWQTMLAHQSSERQGEAIEEGIEAFKSLQAQMAETLSVSGLFESISQKNQIPGMNWAIAQASAMLEHLQRGEILVNSRWDAYHVDEELIESLAFGEILLATVPVIRNEKCKSPFTDLLEDLAFQKYLESVKRAVSRGVVVKRLYLFERPDDVNDELIAKHLIEVQNAGIQIRYIICGSQLSDQKIKLLLNDFLVFGDARVSIGKVNTNEISSFQVEFFTDHELIRQKTSEFDEMWKKATLYSRILENVQVSTLLPLKMQFLSIPQNGKEVKACIADETVMEMFIGDSHEHRALRELVHCRKQNGSSIAMHHIIVLDPSNQKWVGILNEWSSPGVFFHSVNPNENVLNLNGFLSSNPRNVAAYWLLANTVVIEIVKNQSGAYDAFVSTDDSITQPCNERFDGAQGLRSKGCKKKFSRKK